MHRPLAPHQFLSHTGLARLVWRQMCHLTCEGTEEWWSQCGLAFPQCALGLEKAESPAFLLSRLLLIGQGRQHQGDSTKL